MEPNWEWYRTFLGVLDEGSLSAAARELGLTQPTVGRHIDALETALGVKLFTRSQEGYAATEAAEALSPYARNIASTAASLRRIASSQGGGIRGAVRVTASDVVGVEVLPPILAGLRRTHPELEIELVLSNRSDDLLNREADIAVRMFRPVQDVLIARRVGGIELGLHAHRGYLKRFGTPRTTEELGAHALIGFDRETDFIRRFKPTSGEFDRSKFAFRADSDLAQLAAIRAGFGIGICQSALAARDRNLVRVLKNPISWTLDTWIAMHRDLRDSQRCAVTFAALAEGIADYLSTQ